MRKEVCFSPGSSIEFGDLLAGLPDLYGLPLRAPHLAHLGPTFLSPLGELIGESPKKFPDKSSVTSSRRQSLPLRRIRLTNTTFYNGALTYTDGQEQARRCQGRHQRQQSEQALRHRRHRQVAKALQRRPAIEASEGEGRCCAFQEGEAEEDVYCRGVGDPDAEHDHTGGRREAQGQEEGQGLRGRQGTF